MESCTININDWIQDENFNLGCNDDYIDFYELMYVMYQENKEYK